MIPTIIPSDSDYLDLESCCFCKRATRRWTDIKQRTPGQQVACCAGCSGSRKASEVPTKDEWFGQEKS